METQEKEKEINKIYKRNMKRRRRWRGRAEASGDGDWKQICWIFKCIWFFKKQCINNCINKTKKLKNESN